MPGRKKMATDSGIDPETGGSEMIPSFSLPPCLFRAGKQPLKSG